MRNIEMYSVRISKYNPQHTDAYTQINQWTSFSDVGRVYTDNVLSLQEYLLVEDKYVNLVVDVCAALEIDHLQIEALEDYAHCCPYHDGYVTKNIDDIIMVVRGCLREQYWCKLCADQLQIHFGYDYYIYLYSSLTLEDIQCFAQKQGLFTETLQSPYLSYC